MASQSSLSNLPVIWDKQLIITKTLEFSTLCEVIFISLITMQMAPINILSVSQQLEATSKPHHLLS